MAHLLFNISNSYNRTKLITLLLILPLLLTGQNKTITLPESLLIHQEQLFTGDLNGWLFCRSAELPDTRDTTIKWLSLKPSEIPISMADASGHLSGWFMLKFKPDVQVSKIITGLRMGTWAATDVYINGKFLGSFGQTGRSGLSYKAFNPYQQWPTPIYLSSDSSYTLLIRVADRVSPFDMSKWQMQKNNPRAFLAFTTDKYNSTFFKNQRQHFISTTVWISTGLLLALLFWLMYFLHKEEVYLKWFALLTTFSVLSSAGTTLSTSPSVSFVSHILLDTAWSFFGWMMIGMSAVVLAGIFNSKINRWVKVYFFTIAVFGLVDGIISGTYSKILAASISIVVFAIILLTSWRRIKGAHWAIVAGLCSTLIWLIVWAILRKEAIASAILLSFPLSLLVYVALRFRAIQHEIKESAAHVIALAEEKKEILTSQNEKLERQVEERTASLHKSLEELKSTQSLLVQSEKMASLGQLTAGIAHEIQNPLNFINNFSELNTELLNELKTALNNGHTTEATEIINDVIENEEKINHHGKRADSIVKGMLQHSRTSTGLKELTDINLLTDEYLRLAYHGQRAKDKSFNVTLSTDFDANIGMVNIIPQDIGRVLLNLITNAFHAVSAKSSVIQTPYPLKGGAEFAPTVSITTKKLLPLSGGGGVDKAMVNIIVADNGTGIPDHIKDKIFQPFFTTKPTGQGTGLGLSLSYDIIKAHGGDITVNSKEGEFTEFIITLPL